MYDEHATALPLPMPRTPEAPRVQTDLHDREVDSTRSFYEKHADHYARDTWEADVRDLRALFSKSVGDKARVLDLGAGSGRDLLHLAREGHSAVGLDYAYNLARIARNRSDCPVVVADLRALPFRSAAFDAVWAVASLLHLQRREIPHALREIGCVLKPGGVLLTSVKEGSGEELDSRGRFTAYYGREEWHWLLESSGFHTLSSTSGQKRPAGKTGPEVRWLVALSRWNS